MPAASRSRRPRRRTAWNDPTPSGPRSTPNGGGTRCAGRCPRCSPRAGVPSGEVAAVAVDGIGWTLVPVDEAFRPLTPAMTWLDRRAEAEAAALRAGPAAARLDRPRREPPRRRLHHAEARMAQNARARHPSRATRWFLTGVGLPDRPVDGRGDVRPDPGLWLPLLRHPPGALGRAERSRAGHPARPAASAARGTGDRGWRSRGRGRPNGARARHARARRRARCCGRRARRRGHPPWPDAGPGRAGRRLRA